LNSAKALLQTSDDYLRRLTYDELDDELDKENAEQRQKNKEKNNLIFYSEFLLCGTLVFY
jgi:hypothetical protein